MSPWASSNLRKIRSSNCRGHRHQPGRESGHRDPQRLAVGDWLIFSQHGAAFFKVLTRLLRRNA